MRVKATLKREDHLAPTITTTVHSCFCQLTERGSEAVKRFEKGAAKKEIVTGDSRRIMMFLHKAASNIRPQDDQHPKRMKGVIKTLRPS